jgi:hypothetical protein
MRKLQDQEEALEDLMKLKEALIEQQERHQKKCQHLQKKRKALMLQKDSLEGELLQANEMAVSPCTVSTSVGGSRDPFVVLIPADTPIEHESACDGTRLVWREQSVWQARWMDGWTQKESPMVTEPSGQRMDPCTCFVVVRACLEDWCCCLSQTRCLNLLEQGMVFARP